MKLRVGKIFKIGCVLLLLFAVSAAVFGGKIINNFARSKMEEILARETGGVVHVESVHIGLFSGTHTVRGIEVANGKIETVQLDKAVVDVVEVKAGLLSLLGGVPTIHLVRVHGVDVTLAMDKLPEASSTASSKGGSTKEPAKFLVKQLDCTGKITVLRAPDMPDLKRTIEFKQITLTDVGYPPTANGTALINLVDQAGHTVKATVKHQGLVQGPVAAEVQINFDAELVNLIMGRFLHATMNSGRVAITGTVNYDAAATELALKADVRDLWLVEGDGKSDVLRCVGCSVDVTASIGKEMTVDIKDVLVQEPVVYVTRDAKGAITAQGLLVKSESEQSPQPAAKDVASEATPFHLRVGKLLVQGAQVRFEDEGILPGKTLYQVRDLKIDIQPESAGETAGSGWKRYTVDVSAVCPGQGENGSLGVTTGVNLHDNGKISFEGVTTVGHMDLEPFSPYTEHYNKIKIRSGRLWVRVDMGCVEDELNSKCAVAIRDLKFKYDESSLVGSMFNVGADVLVKFLAKAEDKLILESKIYGNLYHPQTDFEEALAQTIEAGPEIMLKGAQKILEDAGLFKIKDFASTFGTELSKTLEKFKIGNIIKIPGIFGDKEEDK